MTPTIIAALERIRALEERPDYMGPKISREIDEARHALELADGLIEYVCDEYGHRATVSIPDEWLEDVIVGVVGPGCVDVGLAIVFERWQNHWYAQIRKSVSDPILDGIEDRSLALAALLAWEAAIGGGEKD